MDYYPNDFEKKIGHVFKDRQLLITALTHSSCAYEMGDEQESNERLEYLGDAVLDFIAAELIYRRFPEMDEGKMTEMRASAVCEKALAGFADTLGLAENIMLGRGEEQSNGNRRPSILADAFEAIVASVYLDGGLEAASNFVIPYLEQYLVEGRDPGLEDYKTTLQEIVQKNKGETLSYEVTGEQGPAHDKTFSISVLLNSNVIGKGTGRSKKEAAQEAAKEALKLMGII